MLDVNRLNRMICLRSYGLVTMQVGTSQRETHQISSLLIIKILHSGPGMRVRGIPKPLRKFSPVAQEFRKVSDWPSYRANALDCSQRGVALYKSYRDKLWRISDPKGADDDLSALRKSSTFLRIVGRTPPMGDVE